MKKGEERKCWSEKTPNGHQCRLLLSLMTTWGKVLIVGSTATAMLQPYASVGLEVCAKTNKYVVQVQNVHRTCPNHLRLTLDVCLKDIGQERSRHVATRISPHIIFCPPGISASVVRAEMQLCARRLLSWTCVVVMF